LAGGYCFHIWEDFIENVCYLFAVNTHHPDPTFLPRLPFLCFANVDISAIKKDVNRFYLLSVL
jgi:hypothetical protein